MVSIDHIRTAQTKVKQARERLLKAFGEWDERVITMHTAFLLKCWMTPKTESPPRPD